MSPIFLMYEGTIRTMRDLLPILEQVAKTGKPILILAGKCDQRGVDHPGGQQAEGKLALRGGQKAPALVTTARPHSKISPS